MSESDSTSFENLIKKFNSMDNEIKILKKDIKWLLEIANFWVDNKGDHQKVVNIAYRHGVKLDHEDRNF